MNPSVTGVLLAGGRGTRMGTPKARLTFHGQPLLPRVVAALLEVAPRVLIVLGPEQELPFALPEGADTVTDPEPGQGPVMGLLAGLRACGSELALVVGCDMPFLEPPLLTRLTEQCEGWDAVVPVRDGRPQYLHAVYRASAVPIIERLLASGARSLEAVAAALRTRFVLEETWRRISPAGLSFTNLNTPDDLRRAERLA